MVDLNGKTFDELAATPILASDEGVAPAFNTVIAKVDELSAGALIIDTNYATLELALAATPTGGILEVRGQWTRTTAFTINKSCTVRFVGGKITVTSASTNGITITVSNVTIVDPNLTGNTSSATGTSDAIYAAGTAGTPLDGLSIIGTGAKWAQVWRWAKHAIRFINTTNFVISNVVIDNVGYAGVMIIGGIDGQILNNKISNVTKPSGYSECYGIAMTRDSLVSLAVSPRSVRILCTGNIIRNVTTWEGIDTHGGDSLTITNNQIFNCYIGIAMIACPDTGGVSTYAPLNMVCANNLLDSQITNGTYGNGISLVGAGTNSSAVEYATGTITGNTVIGYGTENSTGSGGLLIYITKGVVVSGNRVVRCSASGLNLYHRNVDMTLLGNIIEDVWTTAGTHSEAIYVRAEHNTLKLTGNVLTRGTKSATLINARGLYVVNSVGNTIVEQGNDFLAAGLPYVATNGIVRFDQRGVRSSVVNAIPTLGVWERGAVLPNTAVVAAGSPGWVVTTGGGISSATWAATTAYTAGLFIKTAAGKVMECVIAGTSSGVEPTLTTVGDVVTDGTVTWIYRSATSAVLKTMAVVSA